MKAIMFVLMLLPSFVLASPKVLLLKESNTIRFNSKFTGSYVAKKQLEAIVKCTKNPGSEIIVSLYTPGGSVSAGQIFFDTLKALPCQFNTLTIFAASMGYQTVQNLGKRYILPSGILMSHRAYVSGLSGEIGGELDAIVKLLKDNINQLDAVAAKRIGISLEKYKELVRDELWLTSKQAVSQNHADEIVYAKCDKSLSGTYFEKVKTFFGQYVVQFAKCPVITGILSVQFANNKERQKVKNYYENLGKYVSTER